MTNRRDAHREIQITRPLAGGEGRDHNSNGQSAHATDADAAFMTSDRPFYDYGIIAIGGCRLFRTRADYTSDPSFVCISIARSKSSRRSGRLPVRIAMVIVPRRRLIALGKCTTFPSVG
jgi:hypothetical protein